MIHKMKEQDIISQSEKKIKHEVKNSGKNYKSNLKNHFRIEDQNRRDTIAKQPDT